MFPTCSRFPLVPRLRLAKLFGMFLPGLIVRAQWLLDDKRFVATRTVGEGSDNVASFAVVSGRDPDRSGIYLFL